MKTQTVREALFCFFISCFMLLLISTHALAAHESTSQEPDVYYKKYKIYDKYMEARKEEDSVRRITYDQYIKMREASNTIVLDALAVEQLFYVVPPEWAAKGSRGLTEKDLDMILNKFIPDKKTSIILYDEDTFDSTAHPIHLWPVSVSFIANGYKNIYTLEPLEGEKNFFGGQRWTYEQRKTVRQKDFDPYNKALKINKKGEEGDWEATVRTYKEYLSFQGETP